MYTLSSAVRAFESAVGQAGGRRSLRDVLRQHGANNHPESKIMNGLPQNLDLQQLLQQFRPFNVPPPPVPFASEADKATTAKVEQAVHMDDIAEGTQVPAKSNRRTGNIRAFNGRRASVTPSALIVDRQAYQKDPTTSSSSSAAWVLRRSRRQLAMTRGRPTMFLISVKRQRKLKMKKHKYKKLMRRTRNLRRREGRT